MGEQEAPQQHQHRRGHEVLGPDRGRRGDGDDVAVAGPAGTGLGSRQGIHQHLVGDTAGGGRDHVPAAGPGERQLHCRRPGEVGRYTGGREGAPVIRLLRQGQVHPRPGNRITVAAAAAADSDGELGALPRPGVWGVGEDVDPRPGHGRRGRRSAGAADHAVRPGESLGAQHQGAAGGQRQAQREHGQRYRRRAAPAPRRGEAIAHDLPIIAQRPLGAPST